MSKAALVIMAAGIGSRFGGGIKQLEPVGPNGEIIMDYSIKDAMEEISRCPEAMEMAAKAVKLATNFTVEPGKGMWDMMRSMSVEGILKMSSGLVPDGFLESLNAKLIQIDKV